MLQDKTKSLDNQEFSSDLNETEYYEQDLKSSDKYAEELYTVLENAKKDSDIKEVYHGSRSKYTKNKDKNSNKKDDKYIYGNKKSRTSQKNIEQRRNSSEKITVVLYIILVAIVLSLIVLTLFSNSGSTSIADEMRMNYNREAYISPEGNYKFGSFPGFVTVGDTLDEAVSVLGLPTSYRDDCYYFGLSYIIVENDIVVGYYRDKDRDFKVTVGFRELEASIVPGDSAARVVKKLGSPDMYLKYEWVYEQIPYNTFMGGYNSEKVKLTLTFDQDYKLVGYTYH